MQIAMFQYFLNGNILAFSACYFADEIRSKVSLNNKKPAKMPFHI